MSYQVLPSSRNQQMLSSIDPTFSQDKITMYNYETFTLVGLPENEFGRTGINLIAKLEIRAHGPKRFLLKVIKTNSSKAIGGYYGPQHKLPL